MKAEKCLMCGGWAEPPFNRIIEQEMPATQEELSRLLQGEECAWVKRVQPFCRYCAHAMSHGADCLNDEGKDALDLSDEG
jgi:hypothetical protein